MKPARTGQIDIGSGEVTLLEMGGLRMRLDELFDVGDVPGLRQQYPPGYFAAPRLLPQIGLYVALNGRSVLIDPSRETLPPDHPWALPEEARPPSLREQLAAAEIDPQTVTDVVITHLHYDHFSGITTEEGDLLCPHARHHLPQPDWETADIQTALQQPASFESRTLGRIPLAQRELVADDVTLFDGLELFQTPGETEGHLVVRIAGARQIVYYLGDLIHHPIELIYPHLGGAWANGEQLEHVRRRLISRATNEQALLIATHVGLLTLSA